MLNLTAAELLSISLAYYNKACPPTLLHDMSHLSAGMLVNPRAYEIASSLSDPMLVLKRFRHGTHADPESEKLLVDMKAMVIAWSWYKSLVRRSRPWDFMSKVMDNFLLHQEYFVPLDQPHWNFY